MMAFVVKEPEKLKRRNPGLDQGFGVDRHSLAGAVPVEAAGIEPASCEP